jgi:hypothetical protein
MQDSIAMVSQSYQSNGQGLVRTSYTQDNQKKGNYPHRPNAKHYKKGCYQVIGYPAWWKGPKKPLISKHTDKKKK